MIATLELWIFSMGILESRTTSPVLMVLPTGEELTDVHCLCQHGLSVLDMPCNVTSVRHYLLAVVSHNQVVAACRDMRGSLVREIHGHESSWGGVELSSDLAEYTIGITPCYWPHHMRAAIRRLKYESMTLLLKPMQAVAIPSKVCKAYNEWAEKVRAYYATQEELRSEQRIL